MRYYVFFFCSDVNDKVTSFIKVLNVYKKKKEMREEVLVHDVFLYRFESFVAALSRRYRFYLATHALFCTIALHFIANNEMLR